MEIWNGFVRRKKGEVEKHLLLLKGSQFVLNDVLTI